MVVRGKRMTHCWWSGEVNAPSGNINVSASVVSLARASPSGSLARGPIYFYSTTGPGPSGLQYSVQKYQDSPAASRTFGNIAYLREQQ